MSKLKDAIKDKIEEQKTNRYIIESSKVDYKDYQTTAQNRNNYIFGHYIPKKIVSTKIDRCTKREEVYTEDNLIIKTEFSETLGELNLTSTKYQGMFPVTKNKSGELSFDSNNDEEIYVSVEKITAKDIPNYVITTSSFDKFAVKIHNNKQEPPKEFSDLFNAIANEYESAKASIEYETSNIETENENISDSPEA